MKWALTSSVLSLRRWVGKSRHWNREKSGLQTTLTTRVYAYTNTGVLINERRPASPPESIYQQTTTTVSKDQICPSAIRSRRVSRWQTSADTRVRSVGANFSLASRRRVSWQPHTSGAWVRVTGGGQSRRRAKWDLPALNGWQQQLTSFIGWFVDWKLQCRTKFVLPMFWEREHFRRVIYFTQCFDNDFGLFFFSFQHIDSNSFVQISCFWYRFQNTFFFYFFTPDDQNQFEQQEAQKCTFHFHGDSNHVPVLYRSILVEQMLNFALFDPPQ